MGAVNLEAFECSNFSASDLVNNASLLCISSDNVQGEIKTIEHLLNSTQTVIQESVYKRFEEIISASQDLRQLSNELGTISTILVKQKEVLSKVETTIINELMLLKKNSSEDLTINQVLLDKVLDLNLPYNINRKLMLEAEFDEIEEKTAKLKRNLHLYLCQDVLVFTVYQSSSDLYPLKFLFAPHLSTISAKIVSIKDLSLILLHFVSDDGGSNMLYLSHQNSVLHQWINELNSLKSHCDGNTKSSKDKELLQKREILEEQLEEIEILIAVRQFKTSLNKIIDAERILHDMEDVVNPDDVKLFWDRIGLLRSQLINVLVTDLERSSERVLKGDCKTAFNAYQILIELGCGHRANQLYLHGRSLAIDRMLRTKFEGSYHSYVKRVSRLFFTCIHEASLCINHSFLGALFATNLSYWARKQVDVFSSIVIIDSLEKRSANVLKDFSKVIVELKEFISQLALTGMDLAFFFEDALSEFLSEVVSKQALKIKQLLVDALRYNSQKPLVFDRKADFASALQEMELVGLRHVDNLVHKDSFVCSKALFSFIMSFIHFCEDSTVLFFIELNPQVAKSIKSIIHTFSTEVKHVKTPSISKEFSKSIQFIENEVIPFIESKFLQ